MTSQLAILIPILFILIFSSKILSGFYYAIDTLLEINLNSQTKKNLALELLLFSSLFLSFLKASELALLKIYNSTNQQIYIDLEKLREMLYALSPSLISIFTASLIITYALSIAFRTFKNINSSKYLNSLLGKISYLAAITFLLPVFTLKLSEVLLFILTQS